MSTETMTHSLTAEQAEFMALTAPVDAAMREDVAKAAYCEFVRTDGFPEFLTQPAGVFQGFMIGWGPIADVAIAAAEPHIRRKVIEELIAEVEQKVDADGRVWGIDFQPDDLDWHHLPIGEHVTYWLPQQAEATRPVDAGGEVSRG